MFSNVINIYCVELYTMNEEHTELTKDYWRKTSKKYYEMHKEAIAEKRRQIRETKKLEKALLLVEQMRLKKMSHINV